MNKKLIPLLKEAIKTNNSNASFNEEQLKIIETFADLIIDRCGDIVIASDKDPKLILHEPYRKILSNIQDEFYNE